MPEREQAQPYHDFVLLASQEVSEHPGGAGQGRRTQSGHHQAGGLPVLRRQGSRSSGAGAKARGAKGEAARRSAETTATAKCGSRNDEQARRRACNHLRPISAELVDDELDECLEGPGHERFEVVVRSGSWCIRQHEHEPELRDKRCSGRGSAQATALHEAE